MRIYTANRETGTIIEEVKYIEEAQELIEKYEEQDEAEGTYEPNFYDIVNEDHISIRQYVVNYTDENGATSPIDVIVAPANYTENDYINDCKYTTDDDYMDMLVSGIVTLMEVE